MIRVLSWVLLAAVALTVLTVLLYQAVFASGGVP